MNLQFPIHGNYSSPSNHDIKYFLAIDGISLLMIILTCALTPICLLISLNSKKELKNM